ncbi:hypothetical protein HanRHA438_Chr01g0014801 [Helianthus annuus]|nr:hypothetical protein HanIR_Chr01g0016151 [Helianthus annuus]KAJ0947399.1 hypothetical protein HanRHA438_Chr01g0014801 [Helianthus annuus]
MAPTIRRGKIRAQVYRDFHYVLTSFAVKIGETLGFITAATTNNGDTGGGEFPYGR